MSPGRRSAIVRCVPGASVVVPVYYDFASTLCYVAHRVLGRLAERLAAAGIALVWDPVDLTEIAHWRRGAAIDGAQRRHVVAVAHALTGGARVPRTWVDSRGPARVALALAGTPSESAWRERVWTAIYEEGDDPGDPTAVERWARDVGVDPPGAVGADDPLASATRAARDARIVAVPTLLLGDWPMAGIQDDATMLAVLTRFAARRS